MEGQQERFSFRRKSLIAPALLALISLTATGPAHALSALQGMPGSNGQADEQPKDQAPANPGLPLPDPLIGGGSGSETPTALPLNGGKPAPHAPAAG